MDNSRYGLQLGEKRIDKGWIEIAFFIFVKMRNFVYIFEISPNLILAKIVKRFNFGISHDVSCFREKFCKNKHFSILTYTYFRETGKANIFAKIFAKTWQNLMTSKYVPQNFPFLPHVAKKRCLFVINLGKSQHS